MTMGGGTPGIYELDIKKDLATQWCEMPGNIDFIDGLGKGCRVASTKRQGAVVQAEAGRQRSFINVPKNKIAEMRVGYRCGVRRGLSCATDAFNVLGMAQPIIAMQRGELFRMRCGFDQPAILAGDIDGGCRRAEACDGLACLEPGRKPRRILGWVKAPAVGARLAFRREGVVVGRASAGGVEDVRQERGLVLLR